jgi:hypothetical protein
MTCLAPGSLSNLAAMAKDAAVPLAPTIANFSSGGSAQPASATDKPTTMGACTVMQSSAQPP